MVMQMAPRLSVGIIGASGYTGAELLRLAAQHPAFDVVIATGGSQAGRRAADLYPSLEVAYPDLVFESFDPAAIDGLDLAFLGLPTRPRSSSHRSWSTGWGASSICPRPTG